MNYSELRSLCLKWKRPLFPFYCSCSIILTCLVLKFSLLCSNCSITPPCLCNVSSSISFQDQHTFRILASVAQVKGSCCHLECERYHVMIWKNCRICFSSVKANIIFHPPPKKEVAWPMSHLLFVAACKCKSAVYF